MKQRFTSLIAIIVSCAFLLSLTDVEEPEQTDYWRPRTTVLPINPVNPEAIPNIIFVEAKIEDATPPESSYFIAYDSENVMTEESIESLSEYVGELYSVDPKLLQSIAWVESRYDTNAYAAGNYGLCQINISANDISEVGMYDPLTNMSKAAEIISDIQDSKYGSDVSYVLMAYNSGSKKAKEKYESGITSTKYSKEVLSKLKELKNE